MTNVQILPADDGCGQEGPTPVDTCLGEDSAGGDSSLVKAHGSLMLISWGFLLPLAYRLRVLCVTGIHFGFDSRGIQITGTALAIAGFYGAITQFSVFRPGTLQEPRFMDSWVSL